MLLQNKYQKCDYCLLLLSSFCVVCDLFLFLSFPFWMTLSFKRVRRRGARLAHNKHSTQGRCDLNSCLVLSRLLLSCLVFDCFLSSCILLSCILLSCILLSCLVLSYVFSDLVLSWPQVFLSPSGRLAASSSSLERLGQTKQHKQQTVFVFPCLRIPLFCII